MLKSLFVTAASLMLAGLAGAALADDFAGEKPAVQTADRLEWAWDGGDRFSVGGAATVHYQASGAPRIIVRGPADLLSHVRYDHGELRMDHSWFNGFSRDQRLDVTLTGMTLRKVGVAGSGDIHMGDVHQDRLALSIAGSGSVDASGRADDLSLHIAGSGSGHLEKMASATLAANIAGSGKLDAGTADQAQISISGSGQVHFAGAMPKQISVHVSGSGSVTDADGRVMGGRNEARRWRQQGREDRLR